MEVPRNSTETRKRTALGRCQDFFWLGVVFDTGGAMILLTGVFADLPFYDLLLYLGPITIFLSLLWWVFWYTGNIELSPEEAGKKPFRMPSATAMVELSQTLSRRLPLSLSVTTAVVRMQRRQCRSRRRLLLQRAASILSQTFIGDLQRRAKEDQDKDGVESVEKRGNAEEFGREDLGPESEAVKSSEGVCTPGPNAGLVQSQFTPSSLDGPLPLCKRLPAVPLSSTGPPLDTLSPQIQTVAPVVSQSQPSVSVAAQRHLQIPVASKSDCQSLSLASQTQLPPVQASQAQALATKVSLIQLLPAPSFQTQLVDPKVTPAAQHFQAPCDTQQAPKSTALVQEIALSQLSHAQEPPSGQELSQEVPDSVSPLSKSQALATEAQQSMPHESAPTLTTMNSHPH
ncbi:uncharacterized protein LOC118642126 [Molossus molossus]|uniref:Transmembrane protein 238 n=1 Tax=Molossus molossus TaxID=27622 RepID=A0A7J8J039_MOLMO|nr:uncharacterized protein LOC118642126 [Molossus molossus]KAF6489998.1 hypothetical protein HJG59_010375 [Molossus molossus]